VAAFFFVICECRRNRRFRAGYAAEKIRDRRVGQKDGHLAVREHRDVDVPACGLGIGTGLMRGVDQGCATSRSTPGRLTLRRDWRKYSSPASHKSTSALMAASAGRRVFILAAATPIAPLKQADHPAPNICSGLMPLPGSPGDESLMCKRPSELRDAPFRPPVVWAWAGVQHFVDGHGRSGLLVRGLSVGHALQ
jgi:hypothetical protein